MSIIDDLNNLDPSNPGQWPVSAKIVVFVIIFAGIIGAAWHLGITKQRDSLQMLQAKEIEQLEELQKKHKQSANLEILREQLQEMQQSFGDLVRQLPDKTEVASLLVDVSQTGLAAGLDFKLFRPQAEVPEEFYVTLPIEIVVLGSYHQLGEFVSGVAALPRIVTTHDINISLGKGSSILEMKAIAKTYRAEEGDEEGNN